MRSWRARIGVVAPVGNRVSALFNQWAPDGVSFDNASLPANEMSLEGLRAAEERLEESAAVFRSQGHALILYGSNSGSFLDNDGCTERLEKGAGVPGLTAATAVLEAFEALEVHRAVVMTPYPETLNDLTARFLKENGVEVQSITGIGLNQFTDFSYPDLRFLYRNARKLDLWGADVFFLCGMVYETLELVHALEADLRLPVVTGQQAALWAALRHVGIGDTLPRLGRLFQI